MAVDDRSRKPYRLFCYPNSYAMIVHAVLEEIGADYELRWVKIFTDRPDPAFRAASPHLRVPTLLTPDGPLIETGAIGLYLAERHPESGLSISIEDPRRGRFLQWIHYLASTLQPEVNIQYHPENYFAEAADQDRLKAASMKRLARIHQVIEAALDPGPFFFAETRSLCDYILALQAIWPPIYPGTIEDYPAIARLVRVMKDRPAVQRVLAEHGLS